jgi:hypothetical protein
VIQPVVSDRLLCIFQYPLIRCRGLAKISTKRILFILIEYIHSGAMSSIILVRYLINNYLSEIALKGDLIVI